MNQFDKFAKNYNSELDGILNSTIGISSDYFANYKIDEVSKSINNNELPLKILDFGCGIGKNSILLKQMFPKSEIYGIDISDKSIAMAQNMKLENCKFSIYDGENIDFEDGFFDIIFISNVFHHIEHKYHIKILESLRYKLCNSGIIFMFEHNTLNPLTLKIVNECEFDKDASLLHYWYAKKIFKISGFKDIKNRFILFIPPSFKRFLFLEKYLQWLPLGGQYYIIGRK